MKIFRRSRRRIEVCPPGPASFGTFESRWRYWLRWLRPDADALADDARRAFESAMQGLPGEEAERLRTRVRRATSLQELWHLRSAVFGLVARHSSELEAQRRMAALDRLFTTRKLASAPAASRRS